MDLALGQVKEKPVGVDVSSKAKYGNKKVKEEFNEDAVTVQKLH